jgi:hypothetical protein
MQIFEALFILLFAAACVTALIGFVSLFRGRRADAVRIFAHLGFATLLYLGVVAAVGYFSPQRVLRIGDPWCFDDWCLAVEKVTRQKSVETIDLRLFSRARGVSQRANGAWVYLIDLQGNRYAPQPDPSAVPSTRCCNPANP